MTLRDRQTALENEYRSTGYAAAIARIKEAGKKGRAASVPGVNVLLSEYLPAISEVIQSTIAAPTRGRTAKHVSLLRTANPDALALIAIRTAINTAGGDEGHNLSSLVLAIGRSVYRDVMLAEIADTHADLYYVLSEDLDRRMSKDERHRWQTIHHALTAQGVVIPTWPTESRVAVGAFLVGLLSSSGLIDVDRESNSWFLAQDVQDYLGRMAAVGASMSPMVGPCLLPPEKRLEDGSGGFLTPRLAASFRLVRGRPDMRAFSAPVLRCVNALQETAWRVNGRVLDVVQWAAQHRPFGEIASPAAFEAARPSRPDSIPRDLKQENMTPEQAAALKTYRAASRDWHTMKKLRAAVGIRFATITANARKLRDESAFYYVYYADSRGRLYPADSTSLNPQGSDLAKSLLMFAEGLPLHDADAVKWFKINGANKWGFDKAKLAERAAWVDERDDLLIRMGTDPQSYTDWMTADKPWQFLAWVMEYAEFRKNPGEFKSHLAVGLDGSNSGLQHLSALLRDEVGGAATNLRAFENMSDVYKEVATSAFATMRTTPCANEDMEPLRQKWLQIGFSRSDAKRSCMTLPYGVTKKSAETYFLKDRMESGAVAGFNKEEYYKASVVAMEYIWPAIGTVVIKGVAMLDWLKKAARAITKETKSPRIEWVTPSGFVASQTYWKTQSMQVTTHVMGRYDIVVNRLKDTPDSVRSATGLAPNFIHSLDASHLHLCGSRCAEEGITSLHFVHDDFGTHAANTQKLFHILREEFVKMYSGTDPIDLLRSQYPVVGTPPTYGSLDITEVLRSDYCFS